VGWGGVGWGGLGCGWVGCPRQQGALVRHAIHPRLTSVLAPEVLQGQLEEHCRGRRGPPAGIPPAHHSVWKETLNPVLCRKGAPDSCLMYGNWGRKEGEV